MTTIQALVADRLAALEKVWRTIGLDQSEQADRLAETREHVDKLLGAIVAQEQDLADTLTENIDVHQHNIAVLENELGVAVGELPAATLPLIRREEALDAHVQRLQEMKEQRLERLVSLESQLEALQVELHVGSATGASCGDANSVTLARVSALEQAVAEAQAQVQSKRARVKTTMARVASLWAVLGHSPTTPLEKAIGKQAWADFALSDTNLFTLNNVMALYEAKVEERNAEIDRLVTTRDALAAQLQIKVARVAASAKGPLSNADFDKLKAEVAALREQRRHSLRQVIDAVRKDLRAASEKCFVPLHELAYLLTDEDLSEELLRQHEEKVAELTQLLANNAAFYSLLGRRENLLDQLFELEGPQFEQDRLMNRGGILLREEKLKKELPKVEKELLGALADWEVANGRPFTVQGENYAAIIKRRTAQTKIQREQERLERTYLAHQQRLKTELLIEECHFGSQPKTPKLRRFNSSTDASAATGKKKQATPAVAVTKKRSATGTPAVASASKRRALAPCDNQIYDTSGHAPPSMKELPEFDEGDDVPDHHDEDGATSINAGGFASFARGCESAPRSSNLHVPQRS